MTRVLITGTAGFIGFHLAKFLLADGFQVHGFDGMTDYYDVTLKRKRHAILLQTANFSATEGMLEDVEVFDRVADEFLPDVIVHLAGQSGVRYSLKNPRSYIESNVMGTFNVMEAARRLQVRHLLMASTYSVYGANTEMPYRETDMRPPRRRHALAPSTECTGPAPHSNSQSHSRPFRTGATTPRCGRWLWLRAAAHLA
tara:strand:- start:353 stop:949 length:597 start_codon:yes stop_codon:yes gene_type:complete